MIRRDDIDELLDWLKAKIGQGHTFGDVGLMVDVHPEAFAPLGDAFEQEPFAPPLGHFRIRNRNMDYAGDPPGALYKAGLSARQRKLIKAELRSTAECAFLLGVRAASRAASTGDGSS